MNFLRLVKQSLSLDLRSLALYRFLLGLVVMGDVVYRWVDLENFYTDIGLIPRAIFISELTVPWSFSLHLANGSLGFIQVMMLIHLLLGFMLCIGFKTRMSLIGIFLLTISVHNRNWLVQNGGDDVLRVLLFFSIFLPLNKKRSLDSALITNKEEMPATYFSVWGLAFFFQAFAIYFFSFILKEHPDWRSEFTATYYAFRLEIFNTFISRWLLNSPNFLKVFTAVTIYLEAIGPIILLTAAMFFKRWWIARFKVVVFFWLLHLGIICTLKVGLFPYICMAMWTAFIPSQVWDWIEIKVNKLALSKLVIYYDEECLFCKKGVLILKELFLSKSVTVIPAQSDNKAKNEMQSHNSWIVVNHQGARFYKFEAVIETFRHSFFLWALVPLLRFKIVKIIGDKLYSKVADRRSRFSFITEPLSFKKYRPLNKPFSLLSQLVAAVFLITIMQANLHSVKWIDSPNESIQSLGRVTHLFQHWGMFAPRPKNDNIWVEIPATLSNKQKIELLSGESPGSSKSDIFPELVPNEHWRKFFLLLSDGNTNYARYYGGYLCREWNDREIKKVANTTLRKLEIKVYSQENFLDGTKGPVRTKLAWTHWCFQEDFKRDNKK